MDPEYTQQLGLAKKATVAMARARAYAVGNEADLANLPPAAVVESALKRVRLDGRSLGDALSATYARDETAARADARRPPTLVVRFVDRVQEHGRTRMTSLEQLCGALAHVGMADLVVRSKACGAKKRPSRKRAKREGGGDAGGDGPPSEEEAGATDAEADAEVQAAGAAPPAPPPPFPAAAVVLVLPSRLSSEGARRLFLALATPRAAAVRLQVRLLSDLAFDPTANPMVPPHVDVSTVVDDVDAWLTSRGYTRAQLPHLRADDAIALWYDWRPRTVVRCARTDGSIVTRVVVASST